MVDWAKEKRGGAEAKDRIVDALRVYVGGCGCVHARCMREEVADRVHRPPSLWSHQLLGPSKCSGQWASARKIDREGECTAYWREE